MLEHLTLQPQQVVSPLDSAFEAFILSREAMRCTAKTLTHYRYTLGGFLGYLRTRGVTDPVGITPNHVRAYLVSLQRRDLKDTTQHAHARGVKAWLNWLVVEGDLKTSPMGKVVMPKLEARIPQPFSAEDVQKLLAACDRRTPIGARNYAIVLTLVDTGLRAAEFATLCVGGIDSRSGLVTIMGKGQKQRQVRVGATARAAIARMLALCCQVANGDPLWLAYDGRGQKRGGLTLHGLQTVLLRLGKMAGVSRCAPHRFRRTFALWCLRDGMDLHNLRLLMGHSDLTVLQRYLALAGEDVGRAHAAHSPVDRLLSGQEASTSGRRLSG